jgi:5-formyltetrahydrofolate cyclo-ligase
MVSLKDSLREKFRSARRSFHLDSTLQKNILVNLEKVFESILETLSSDSLVVGAYYPKEEEINILPFLDWLREKKIVYSIPKIRSTLDREMDFLLFESAEKTKENVFNFFEPFDSEVVSPNIIILPLIACDLKGNRIGYGKGYYDKYLARLREKRKGLIVIGICYEEQISKDFLPEESHDQKLDIIVTQKKVHHPAMMKS